MKTKKPKRIQGWIVGNNLKVRGYYQGEKGMSDGEPWYTELKTKRGWSAYDVEFLPDKMKEIP